MMIVLDSIPSEQEDAVRALQDAMLAMLVNAEGKDTARRAPACEPTEPTRAAERGRGLLRRGPGGCEMVRGGHAALASAHRAVTVLRAPRKGCAGGLMLSCLTRFASCFGLS